MNRFSIHNVCMLNESGFGSSVGLLKAYGAVGIVRRLMQ